ncbi:hypothetical protein HWHPT5561_04415 [Petrotoga sp. HWH.PT.55.6.1]|uniref:hypothetical protein n=1 Tax=unclassified Petrotoga TaxID=2620614 RepID=UPI000CA04634|nr:MULTISPECIES: hypothetical protein [unclassified Petrotoga]PNR90788.1 hypothetical protein X926_10290 [Petrotoga sp. HWHPT.55.6.3]RPD36012.1 hypothetical protein HWHPT5561_04415 [Petrotoga sp. HWH.PT.55.6.1]
MKKLFIILLIVSSISLIIFSEGLRSFDSSLNPLLLESIGKRNYFEIELSPDIMVYQNAYKVADLLPILTATKFTVDFDDIYASLGADDLFFITNDNVEGHLVVNIFDLGVGVVLNGDLKSDLTVPNDLIDLIANGNEIDTTNEGTMLLNLDTSFKAGAYASYNFDGMSVGLVYNLFLPIVYTEESDIGYELSTDTEEGTITAQLNMNVDLYSPFDSDELDSITFNTITDKFLTDAGHSIDAGVTFGEIKNPVVGIAVKNITVIPAKVSYKISYQETISLFGEDSSSSSPIEVESVNETYAYPMSVTGFFRIPVVLLDVIPYGEFYVDTQEIDWGVQAKTSLFNFIPLTVGIENYHDYWSTFLGFGIDSRIIESRTELSLTAKDLEKIFDLNGFTFKSSFAIGF